MSGTQKTEGVRRIWDKYKFVALVALAGVLLLLWPSGREETASPQAVSAVQAELQEEMEDICADCPLAALARMIGVER